MDKSLIFWTVALCAVVISWFCFNLNRGEMNYPLYPSLKNKTTGDRVRVDKFLNLTESIEEPASYVEMTNSDERWYKNVRDNHIFIPALNDQSYSNPQVEAISGWPTANQSQCDIDLREIIGYLQMNPNYILIKGNDSRMMTRYMDSFGKVETGHYEGLFAWPGSYEICQKSSLFESRIKTRYCWTKYRMPWWPDEYLEYPVTGIRIGICLPDSCDSQSIRYHNESIDFLTKYQLTDYYKENLRLYSLFCLPDERSSIRQMPLVGKAFIFILITWMSIIIISSILHKSLKKLRTSKNVMTIRELMNSIIYKPKNHQSVIDQEDVGITFAAPRTSNLMYNIFEGLTLQHSIKVLFSCPYQQPKDSRSGRVDLRSIDFFKSLFSILIILSHSLLMAGIFSRDVRGRINLGIGNVGKIIITIGRFIDSYFVFFGLFTSFTLLKKFKPNQLANPLYWIAANTTIFLRIFPLYAITYIYNRSVSPYTGSGPWWDYGVDRMSFRGHCQNESWFKIIPYFGSTSIPPVPGCNSPAWFIVSYIQLSLLLPLITYLLYKLPNFLSRFLLVGFIVFISSLSVGINLSKQEAIPVGDFTKFGGFLGLIVDKYEISGYLTTFGHLHSVSIGCFIGYILYQYKNEIINNLPNWLTGKVPIFLVIVLHIFLYVLPIIGRLIYDLTGDTGTIQQFVLSNMISMIVWPLFNSVLIINVTTRYNNHSLVRLMSHPFWYTFNKLGLSMLLVQMEILLLSINLYERGQMYGFYMDVLKVASFTLISSILVSIFLFIFVEAPLAHLVAMVMRPIYEGKSEPQSVRYREVNTVEALEKTDCLNLN